MEPVKAPDDQPRIVLERLIRENQVSLKRLCYLYLHDEAMAEDAVQETFLKVYRSLGAFRGEAKEKTYLTRIAINTCKDMLRSAWFRHVDRRATVDRLPAPQSVPDPYHREVAAAVMNLPRKRREVILLYYFQGLSTLEIADILKISQPAVTGRLKRAREQLKTVLKGGDFDDA
ncbi:MAG: sigma-70 family RNA polymerase sigma factor [Clostridiales bacterium]|nr:sigma-70 family RNA polymerase sigma factor [Clostridiales bacterium]